MKNIGTSRKEYMKMNYRGEYGRERYGRGDYEEGGYSRGRYGRRGVKGTGRGRYRRGNYRGEEMIDEMYSNYGEYSEGKEEYNRGNYGAKDESMKALDCMLQTTMDFFEYLEGEAGSQEEMELIKEYKKEIGKM